MLPTSSTAGVRKSGDHLRFSVQLVQASTGTVVWSETYDREVADVFALQEDVAGAVVERAGSCAWCLASTFRQANAPANAQAYELYLQGLKYGKESQSVDDMRRAMDAFEKAVALDPNFATGYAHIALVAANNRWRDSGRRPVRAGPEQCRARPGSVSAAGPGLHRARQGAHVQRLGLCCTKADLDTALASTPTTRKCRTCRSITCSLPARLQRRLLSRSASWSAIPCMPRLERVGKYLRAPAGLRQCPRRLGARRPARPTNKWGQGGIQVKS